jgi:hypothetical protein
MIYSLKFVEEETVAAACPIKVGAFRTCTRLPSMNPGCGHSLPPAIDSDTACRLPFPIDSFPHVAGEATAFN